MTFKEYLVSTGVSEEQADTIVAGMPAEKLYIASEENLDIRYEKLKGKHDQLEADLNAANETLGTLKEQNKDVEGLQSTIDDYKKTVADLEATRAQEQKTFAVKEALTKAGVSDADYMMYKLGEVEMDKEGNLVDWDIKLKELKESNPTFFASENNADTGANNNGFKVYDNKLPGGNSPKIYSSEELRNMTTEEINENWDAVNASLENGDGK